MSYRTQMEAARKGIITDKMKNVMKYEGVDAEYLLKKMSEGKIVIPANIRHLNNPGIGVGEGLKTKINVNIGVSEDCFNIEMETEKIKRAINMKADALMDLSIFGETAIFRKKVIEISDILIGSVPVYDVAATYGERIAEIKKDDFFKAVEAHAADGIDFVTVHAGLTRTAIQRIEKSKRLTHIVSRGGSMMYEWMNETGNENPFYEDYGRLLDICKKYDVTLSLGDGLRPGSISDSTDAGQIQELIILGELTKDAWQENVQVMVEGPGHVPIHEVVSNIQLQKKLCHGAPFYVLGPLVTDIAPGYDHITSAIGGALAASAGADFLCYVTPAEHLRLPDIYDMEEGIIASRIAAHAGDLAKGVKGAMAWDNEMSKARMDLDWESMYRLAINPEKARRYRESANLKDKDTCSMCGALCAVKRSKRVIEKNSKI